MGSSKFPPWDPYERTRTPDGNIRSVCMRCDVIMSATDVESLVTQELAHLHDCPERDDRIFQRARIG